MFRLFKNEISNIFGGQFWPAGIWTQIWASGSAEPIEFGSETLKKNITYYHYSSEEY